MTAWRECKWVGTSCQSQGRSSCDSGCLALTSSAVIWGPASQLTSVPSTGLHIYLDMNEAWSSCSHCQGRPLFRRKHWQQPNVRVTERVLGPQARARLLVWKFVLHNASPQQKWGAVGIPSRRFSLFLLLSSWGSSFRAWGSDQVASDSGAALPPCDPRSVKSHDGKWWSWEPTGRPPCSRTVPEQIPNAIPVSHSPIKHWAELAL